VVGLGVSACLRPCLCHAHDYPAQRLASTYAS
jgi:hypothetical protein